MIFHHFRPSHNVIILFFDCRRITSASEQGLTRGTRGGGRRKSRFARRARESFSYIGGLEDKFHVDQISMQLYKSCTTEVLWYLEKFHEFYNTYTGFSSEIGVPPSLIRAISQWKNLPFLSCIQKQREPRKSNFLRFGIWETHISERLKPSI